MQQGVLAPSTAGEAPTDLRWQVRRCRGEGRTCQGNVKQLQSDQSLQFDFSNQQPKTPTIIKKPKPKIEKKPAEAPAKPLTPTTVPAAPQQQQPQILTILQQPQQQQVKVKNEPQPQQIIISMSQAQAMLNAQQQKGAVYTFPTNLILNANGTFMSNTGEVVSNFKFENQ